MSTTDPKGENSEDFAAMLAEFERENAGPAKGLKNPRPGEQVRGKVVSIGQDAVFVDLGAKSEGMLDVMELRDADGKLTVAVGDFVEARVVEGSAKAGCIVLRRVLGRGPDGKAELEEAFQHEVPVEGVVTGVNKGGVEVQVAGVRAFCPISQLASRHVEDAASFVGQKLTFRITRYESSPKGMNIVLSRRVLLDEEQAKLAAETRAHLAPGVVLKGKVTTIKDYGAFVDLGGLEGMLHVSELGFARVGHPKDLLTVGQEIEVQILKIERGEGKRTEKISLSLKALERDPWQGVVERFPEGARVPGVVARVETFGAFVELAPGIEGLVHISELPTTRKINHAREVVKPGQAVQVVVLGVDLEKRRIALSLAPPGEEGEDRPVAPAVPQRLGTFGDLLKSKKPR